jgi:hypothetical protein
MLGTGGVMGAVGGMSGTGGVMGAGGAMSGVGGSPDGTGGLTGGDAGSNDAQSLGPATRAFVPTVSMVRSIVISDGVIYAGGLFDTSRTYPFPSGIAALDETTLSPMPAWVPQIVPFVNTLAVSNGRVYAGLDIGNGDLLALDAATGSPAASLPSANSAVTALAVGGGTIYFGGIFMTVGGTARNEFAAVDATTGALKSWAPNDTYGQGWALAMAISGNTLFAGGSFTLSNGSNGTRKYLTAIDATTGAVTPWNPAPNGYVDAVVINASRLYVGGLFSTIAGQPRAQAAVFDLSSGALLPWDPGIYEPATPMVKAIAVQGTVVYLGGKFTHVGGQPRGNLAAVDADTAAVLPWSPMTSLSNSDPNAVPSTLAASDTVVVAGINGTTAVTGVAFYPPASP